MPKNNMEHGEPISSTLRDLIERYGPETFRIHLTTIMDLLQTLDEYGERIKGPDAERDENAYQETLDLIAKTTRDYYAYLGRLPEELRRVFQSLSSGDADAQDALEEISALLNMELPENALRPSLQAIRPRTYIMQLDAITNQLTTLSGRDKLKVGARGSQPVKTTVTLDLPSHMRIGGGVALTTYDKSIINGVTSLLESGNPVFSIPMLYHAMTGKQNPTVDEQLFDELAGKLEKMRMLTIAIDLSEENHAHFITDENGDELSIEHLTIEGYLLPLEKVSGIINGKQAKAYRLIQNPPLYTYSKMKRQLASVPITLLSAPINNNSTTIPLKTYLLQRIEMMKNEKNSIRSNTILYDTIYGELGDKDANKTRKMRIRTYSATILDYFIEQGYIKGYSAYKKGRNIAGVKIEL